jgi:hypothetical protein
LKAEGVRASIQGKKQEFKIKEAVKRAEREEKYAEDTILFATYMIDEAEQAVLNAVLARLEAEELAAQPVGVE